MGNIVNRVFDSSGPEGKVRGTPQQIIDKYLMLARDAQLGNDRVAAENFLQHAEHYARMLSEAQREMEAQRQNQQGGNDQQPRGGQDDGGRDDSRGDRDENRGDRRPDNRGDSRGENRGDSRGDRRPGGYQDDQRDQSRPDRRQDRAASDVIDVDGDDGPGLVETPETRRAEATPAAGDNPRGNPGEAPPSGDAAAEAGPRGQPVKPRRERRPRGARNNAEASSGPGSEPPSEAAE